MPGVFVFVLLGRLQYMSRGNLAMVLKHPDLIMDWPARVSIAIDAAKGMQCLHVSVLVLGSCGPSPAPHLSRCGVFPPFSLMTLSTVT